MTTGALNKVAAAILTRLLPSSFATQAGSGANLGEESLDSGFISWFLVEQKNSSNSINHNVLILMGSYVTYAFSCTFVIPQKLLVR